MGNFIAIYLSINKLLFEESHNQKFCTHMRNVISSLILLENHIHNYSNGLEEYPLRMVKIPVSGIWKSSFVIESLNSESQHNLLAWDRSICHLQVGITTYIFIIFSCKMENPKLIHFKRQIKDSILESEMFQDQKVQLFSA